MYRFAHVEVHVTVQLHQHNVYVSDEVCKSQQESYLHICNLNYITTKHNSLDFSALLKSMMGIFESITGSGHCTSTSSKQCEDTYVINP